MPGPEASWGRHVLGPVWVPEGPCGCHVRLTGVRARPLRLDQGHTGFLSYPPLSAHWLFKHFSQRTPSLRGQPY